MSASEPNRSELPPHTPSREELAVAPTQAFQPDEPSSQLASLLDEYLAELQAGRRPDRQKLLAEHPELAAQLEQCLSGIEFIHQASVVRPSSEPLGQLGDFRIIREVGRGGMGVVYEAEQVSLKRRIALKVLRYGAASDSEAMQRFQREAETVATLHHTNIVPIFAIGCEGGVNYYAMQFIEGRSLANVAESLRDSESGHGVPRRQRDVTEIANWGLQAADALAHAHLRGVIHRDIKPSNVIVGAFGEVAVLDWGLAKRLDDEDSELLN
ncbi:MAG: serine/threonine protein kinase, partial [Planctomycetaceae bacterium]|nr:serine/threonine protein kinase [Planctomycetaceae bacterium]